MYRAQVARIIHPLGLNYASRMELPVRGPQYPAPF